jgi:hypothetical protein
VLEVKVLTVRREEPVHPAAEVADRPGCRDEVEVIRHHAACQDRKWDSLLRSCDQRKE